jgi:hypothetical protein
MFWIYTATARRMSVPPTAAKMRVYSIFSSEWQSFWPSKVSRIGNPTYRKRFITRTCGDKKLFAKLAGIGKELVDLHLLKSSKVEDFITTYPEPGDNTVEKVVYVTSTIRAERRAEPEVEAGRGGRVWINSKQFFGDVPEEVWNFKVGGYQVCEKWLKDRRGRALSSEEITHYQKVVVALQETIRLMEKIDRVVDKWPVE